MTESAPSGGFTTNVAGRTVVVRTGTRSQTVNISTTANVAGTYESRYRLDLVNAVRDESDISDRASLAVLRAWLAERNARDEGGSGTTPTPPIVVDIRAEDADWINEAISDVDAAINALVKEFVRRPYRHRVEHSLHTELVTRLMQSTLINQIALFHDDRCETQLVHKEWPETNPRADRGKTVERRGLFDVVVLTPDQLRHASLDQFREGRIAAPIVIELGLDYGAGHLQQDIDKLENSEVVHGRLVHLTRLPQRTSAVVDLVNSVASRGPALRAAYGYRDRDSGATAIKLLEDDAVTTT